MVGTYTGAIACPKCGTPNVFEDSSVPIGFGFHLDDDEGLNRTEFYTGRKTGETGGGKTQISQNPVTASL
jgi:hypothetical protein